MDRGVIVGLAGLFRGQSAVRRKWSDVRALAPLALRARRSRWLSPLPDPAAIAAAVAALAPGPAAVAGQPGACAAVGAWAEALGVPVGGAPLVALLGSAAAEQAVDAAVAAGRRVGVACADDGEGVEPPPGGVWIADAWAGEGTRGVLGAGVLTVLGLAGVDVAAGLAGAAAMAEACQAPVADNPAWSLARGLRLLAQEEARDAVVHVAADPRLSAFVAWAARAQAVQLAPPSPVVAARPLPAFALEGDQEWTEAVVRGRDRVVVAWELGGGAAWGEFADAGVPIVRVQLPALDAEALGAAFRLWLGALEVLALLEERRPAEREDQR